MDTKSTQTKIEALYKRMTDKLDLIAEYIKENDKDCAFIELWTLQELMLRQKEIMVESLPGKKL